MKIRIEITEDAEEEIVIKANELNETIIKIQKAIQEMTSQDTALIFYKGETQYYQSIDTILFFETSADGVSAHTVTDIYEVKYRLYELEEILPPYFMRVSKSTILNLRYVYAITKNITASSVVEFKGTHKKVYVSRNYYKALITRLEEKRNR